MDSFKPGKTTTRKTKATGRKSTVQILSSLFFRAIEVTVVVTTVAKLFSQLVTTFENSGERVKGLAFILSNRHFVFFVGNVIAVITFLTKYGKLPNQESDLQSASNDAFYEEFIRESRRREEKNSWADQVKNVDKNGRIQDEGTKEDIVEQNTTGTGQRPSKSEKVGGTENKGKHITTEHRQKERATEIDGIIQRRDTVLERRPRQDTGEIRAKQKTNYTRSWPENTIVCCGAKGRSETERYLLDTVDVNEGMSNDELRHKIESFIARQRRIQKGE
ncbi:PREDICTED: uncharacterized protein LOC104804540 [Tarenaya hassleriana]|uniref:uncharacterized protein LOC104804540 n=1 Tax=Tarenaya hassleriana TaxID=28532 RepID=UPI00053C62E8|nr:PREDICTED: uncharacterized protein LOC104804540 [Tarenaya hassleriana]